MYPGDVPFSWKITLKDDGVPVDIINSEISAPVLDDGVELGRLTVEKTNPVNGQVKLTFIEALHVTRIELIDQGPDWRAIVAESKSPRCPKCRQPNRLTLTMNESGTGAEALCRRCGAQVTLEKRDGKWIVVMQGAAASIPILNFLGVDKLSDIVDWVQDTL
jgi:hypothetical protein